MYFRINLNNMRKLIFLIIAFVSTTLTFANDNISFVTSAPNVVVNGEQFRLEYTVNTQNVKDFRAPSIKDFEVLMGPSRSQQSSTQIINGKVSSSSSITFTYILMAEKEGTFNIPGATLTANGSTVRSNSVKVKVLPPDKASSASGRSSHNSSSAASSGRITNSDLFITVTANKTKVYEQEAILLTYKVYTLVNLRQLYGKMPDLKGFHTQEIQLPQQKSFSLEHYKGKNYNTTTWSQYLLFPQQTGKLKVPSLTFDAIIAKQIISDDPFDAFFNGGTNFQEVKKKIVTPSLIIDVKPLPAKPANFSGGVGEFNIKASINSNQIKTNDALTLKVIISGIGNLKLINTPKVNFPSDFDVYDPKVDNKINVSGNGLSGTKQIEYLAVPRSAGTYTIDPVEFVYFDLKTQSYKTIKTQPFTVNVEKGKGNADQVIADFTNKEDVKVLANDIRYIKTGDTTYSEKDTYLFGSLSYILCYFIPLALFIIILVLYRKQAIENANIVKMRTKKANKVATKRMKFAGKLLSEHKKNEFYDEVLKALWGYISDKLNIPVSELSKENIEEKMTKYGVSADLIKVFIGLLNDCEFARYAPGDQERAMDNTYSSAISIISQMENSIKH